MLQTRIPNPRVIESREHESASVQQTLSYAFAVFGRQYPLMILTLLLCISLAVRLPANSAEAIYRNSRAGYRQSQNAGPPDSSPDWRRKSD